MTDKALAKWAAWLGKLAAQVERGDITRSAATAAVRDAADRMKRGEQPSPLPKRKFSPGESVEVMEETNRLLRRIVDSLAKEGDAE